MRIINLVDNLSKVNYGIWNAAINTSTPLFKKYGVESEVWYPITKDTIEEIPEIEGLTFFGLKNQTEKLLKTLIALKNLSPEHDIIVSHGCWRFPTAWGAALKNMGFKWVYTPHGMLEPWSRSQKWLKKKIYYRFVEYPRAKQATTIRAVSSVEAQNLKVHFKGVEFIPNGSPLPKENISIKTNNPRRVIFLGRFHFKKGIVPLINAWKKSPLMNNPDWELLLGGTDDGELPKMQKALEGSNVLGNIKILGPVFGEEKHKLLSSGSYFALTTFSEGFPSSLVEAMMYGLAPIYTEGCNFPEATNQNLGYLTEPNEAAIFKTLKSISEESDDSLLKQRQECRAFVLKNYTLEHIADLQFSLYNNLIA